MRVDVVEAGTPEFAEWVPRWYERWSAALEAGICAGRKDPVLLTRQDRLAMLREAVKSERRYVVALVDGGGDVVGAARVDLPLADNLSVCWMLVTVPPHARRLGHGTALLRAVRDLAVEDGRTSLLTEIERPLGDPGEWDCWPGTAFAARSGFTQRLVSVRRDLRLPVDPGHVDRLRREALPHAAGYRVVAFPGPVSPDDREQMAALKARMTTDAPMGDLDYEPEAWDAARVVEQENEWAGMGITWWTAVAVAPDGAWAGHTQLLWSPRDPQRLLQEDTLVLKEHRGRRLGMLMKLAALEQATAAAPQARVVVTGNAASNEHMIAINEAIGFRATELFEEWQADVSQLA